MDYSRVFYKLDVLNLLGCNRRHAIRIWQVLRAAHIEHARLSRVKVKARLLETSTESTESVKQDTRPRRSPTFQSQAYTHRP